MTSKFTNIVVLFLCLSAAPFNGITQRSNPPTAPAQKVNENPGKKEDRPV